MKIYNLTNKRFGKLKVLEITNKRTSNKKILWKCICNCGNICLKSGTVLVHQNQKSCGKCKKDYSKRNCSIKGKGHPRFSHGLAYDEKKYMILKRYKLNYDEYLKLLKEQYFSCAICKNKESSKSTIGKIKRLAVDHNHKTGKVRGLLCDRCNRGIGMLKENPRILKNAIEYLEKDNELRT